VKTGTTTLIVVSAALSALALAGVPCPDPYKYHKTDGYCELLSCGGWHGVNYTVTNGGCMTPGHSAVKCGIESLAMSAKSGVVSGGTFDNLCGQTVWFSCTETNYGLLGVKSGKATADPCPYNCNL
jgi:hypothetical protein